MKTFISLIAALMILYVGRDSETRMSIVEKPAPPLSTMNQFEVKYQHIRFKGAEIEIVVHDLWESQVVWLRLPADIQVGDSIALDKHHLQYQKMFVYRTIEGSITIQKSQKELDSYIIEGKLNFCATDENEIFCLSNMPIRIVY